MKREIKFRVWDDRVTRYIANPEDVRLNVGTGEAHGKLSSGNVDHWLLEQYTGLKDKNGVEIYGGDKVEGLDFENHIVVEGVFFDIVQWHPFAGQRALRNVEVIGNIHE